MRTIIRLPLLVMILGLSACGETPAPPAMEAGASNLAVSLAPVQRQELPREVVASGQIAAWQDMPLGVEISGLRVSEVLVEIGQSVSAGQVLLRLDDRGVQSERAQAEAALHEAVAAGKLADANLARGQSLRERRLLSAADLDQLQAAQLQAKARVEASRASLDAAQLRVSYTVLRAPDAGTISRRQTQPGEVVQAGAELLGLIRQGRLEWRAQIAEADLTAVAVGQPVRVRALEGSEVEGRVRAVAPGLDANTRTALLQADLAAPGPLRAGMVVEGRIHTGSSSVLTAPLSAVVRRDGYAYVFSVDEKSRVARHRVDVGRVSGDQAEILSGIEDGSSVVARGAGFLSEGDRVRVVADDAAGTP
ncbi:MAG TPA: efflux RND transporter periplasmic adaptor subunit [Chiayiivirga sp.]|nr:efflux RND transporter periplasmic adaptor subunit [Chiayiivirga sp.]